MESGRFRDSRQRLDRKRHFVGFYQRAVLPKLIELAMQQRPIEHWAKLPVLVSRETR